MKSLDVMPKATRLILKIPYLVDAEAEGPLAVILLFILVLALIAVHGAFAVDGLGQTKVRNLPHDPRTTSAPKLTATYIPLA